MRKPRTPSYRRQKQKNRSDQAFVEIDGQRHYLGAYGSPESRARYQRIVGDWLAGGEALPLAPEQITIEELLAYWLRWAEKHYRNRHGRPTTGLRNCKQAIRWLREMFGEMYVAEIGPRHIKAIQQAMTMKGYARVYVNKNIDIIKAVFRWGVAEELVEPQTRQAIEAVRGLQKGRTDAPETEPVKPVSDEHVDACLPHLPRPVRAMVELQRATGMRPAEVVSIRPCDLDMSGEVWVYQPADHKNAHHDHQRLVFIGPRGQKVLQPWLQAGRSMQKPIFSPRDAVADLLERRRGNRQTPDSCGNRPGSNRTDRPARAAGDAYDVASYRRAIHRACAKVWPVPEGHTEAERKRHRDAHRWSPNQLRHTYATHVRRDYGLEAAQVLLGHARADVTQLYAERDIAKAQQVAQQVG